MTTTKKQNNVKDDVALTTATADNPLPELVARANSTANTVNYSRFLQGQRRKQQEPHAIENDEQAETRRPGP